MTLNSQVQKQAEANNLLLTKEYLELKRIEAMSSNNKVESKENVFVTNITINNYSRFISGPTFPTCSYKHQEKRQQGCR